MGRTSESGITVKTEIPALEYSPDLNVFVHLIMLQHLKDILKRIHSESLENTQRNVKTAEYWNDFRRVGGQGA